jgi:hypothetical protein
MTWRGMTSGGVHSPGACRRRPGVLQRLCGIGQSHRPARKGRPAGGISPVPSAQRGGHPSGPGADVRTVRSASLVGEVRCVDHRKRKSLGRHRSLHWPTSITTGSSAPGSPSRSSGHKRGRRTSNQALRAPGGRRSRLPDVRSSASPFVAGGIVLAAVPRPARWRAGPAASASRSASTERMSAALRECWRAVGWLARLRSVTSRSQPEPQARQRGRAARGHRCRRAARRLAAAR